MIHLALRSALSIYVTLLLLVGIAVWLDMTTAFYGRQNRNYRLEYNRALADCMSLIGSFAPCEQHARDVARPEWGRFLGAMADG